MTKHNVLNGLNLINLLIFVGCSSTQKMEVQPSPRLCYLFKNDLHFIRDTLASNSSDYNGSPELRERSEAIFKGEMVKPCSSDLDYVRGVKRYLASYRDPHVNAIWTDPDPIHSAIIETSTGRRVPKSLIKVQLATTGVYLQKYGDKYFVKDVDNGIIKSSSPIRIADELIDCDGKTPSAILKEEILPYISVSAEEAAMSRFTPLIFARWDRSPDSVIKCRFLVDAKPTEITMRWMSVPDDYVIRTFQKSPDKIYEIEKTSYGHWVKLKSLGGYDASITEQLKKFVSDAKSLRRDKLIVLDLRGNNGGSSGWGTDWIDLLWGFHGELDKGIREYVFVTSENRKHFERLFENLKAHGGIESSFAKAEWSDLLGALEKGPEGAFSELHEPPVKKMKGQKSGFHGQVIVLTDFNVFSSGETFLEQLKMMPRVKQAGIPTNASTYFSDVRFVVTPSGLPFDFPTKMDSGDPLGRKSGEALTPDWPLGFDAKLELEGKDSLRAALEQRISAGK